MEAPDDPNVARVLVKKVRVERTRRFGDCYLGLELWKRLGLDEFFAQHLDGDPADVAWSRVAAVLAINRLCAPGSELAVGRWTICCTSEKAKSTTRGGIVVSTACCR
ncbi:MAG TPA: hypothetical protein VIX91_18475 [Candidatus Acidoferrum sp.]